MYVSFFIYSLSGIFSKLASNQDFLSVKYCLCFFGILFILGLYAILWQQILKKIELSVAMANKPVVLVLSTLWACFIFNEKISLTFVIAMLLIGFGVFLVTTDKESN